MTMTQDEMKRLAAQAALEYLPDEGIIGVGTGSTVNHFIDSLAGIKGQIYGTVASSEASAERLKSHGIPVLDLNSVDGLSVYIDGADESNARLELIKGGGGALTREKIVAAASKKFVCIADESKLVDVLGEFPLPVEVIPMARSHVAREIVKLGGDPVPQRERHHDMPGIEDERGKDDGKSTNTLREQLDGKKLACAGKNDHRKRGQRQEAKTQFAPGHTKCQGNGEVPEQNGEPQLE